MEHYSNFYIIIPAKLSISELREWLLDNLFNGKSIVSVSIDRDDYFFNKMFIDDFSVLEDIWKYYWSNNDRLGFNEYINTDYFIDNLKCNCSSKEEFIDISTKWYRNEIENIFVYHVDFSDDNPPINSIILNELIMRSRHREHGKITVYSI